MKNSKQCHPPIIKTKKTKDRIEAKAKVPNKKKELIRKGQRRIVHGTIEKIIEATNAMMCN